MSDVAEKTLKVEVKYEVNVPIEDWINFLTQYNDIFRSDYCGYWLRGVKRDETLGWLVWEDDEEHRRGEEPNLEQALEIWRAGDASQVPLPPGWFVINKATAIKAYQEGCKLWGEEWMDGEHSDALGYDRVIQRVLLGEERYG